MDTLKELLALKEELNKEIFELETSQKRDKDLLKDPLFQKYEKLKKKAQKEKNENLEKKIVFIPPTSFLENARLIESCYDLLYLLIGVQSNLDIVNEKNLFTLFISSCMEKEKLEIIFSHMRIKKFFSWYKLTDPTITLSFNETLMSIFVFCEYFFNLEIPNFIKTHHYLLSRESMKKVLDMLSSFDKSQIKRFSHFENLLGEIVARGNK